MESLEASVEVLRRSETTLQEDNTRITTELKKKRKDAESALELREECARLREQVQELQRDNSAQQAKMLMSALGGTSGGNSMSSGLGSLMNPYKDSGAGGEVDDVNDGGQAERTRQLEREVSTLTNQNLKLQENLADL